MEHLGALDMCLTTQQMTYLSSDDTGHHENGMDNGGPKHEFLTLLMTCLRSRWISDGPEDSMFIHHIRFTRWTA